MTHLFVFTPSSPVKLANILAQPKTNSNRSKLCTNVKYEPCSISEKSPQKTDERKLV